MASTDTGSSARPGVREIAAAGASSSSGPAALHLQGTVTIHQKRPPRRHRVVDARCDDGCEGDGCERGTSAEHDQRPIEREVAAVADAVDHHEPGPFV